MSAVRHDRVRLMILDDHQLILTGIQQMLIMQDNFDILGIFLTSSELFTALQKDAPDIILIDYSLRQDDIDGVNLIRVLKTRFPAVRILVMSSFHIPAIASLVIRCGANGFIGKELSLEDMLTAIRVVMDNRIYLSPSMVDKLRFNQTQAVIDNNLPITQQLDSNNVLTLSSKLSKREQEVLRCCLEGMTMTQIAAKFSRSIKTISGQKLAAYKKLGVDNDNELFKIREQLENI